MYMYLSDLVVFPIRETSHYHTPEYLRFDWELDGCATISVRLVQIELILWVTCRSVPIIPVSKMSYSEKLAEMVRIRWIFEKLFLKRDMVSELDYLYEIRKVYWDCIFIYRICTYIKKVSCFVYFFPSFFSLSLKSRFCLSIR